MLLATPPHTLIHKRPCRAQPYRGCRLSLPLLLPLATDGHHQACISSAHLLEAFTHVLRQISCQNHGGVSIFPKWSQCLTGQ